jgi:phosphoribosylaminoimidazole carboxylase (NCAIR synthetase)
MSSRKHNDKTNIVIGCLGAGQLGMMMAEACLYHFANVSMILLDDSGSDSPTAAVSGSNVLTGS